MLKYNANTAVSIGANFIGVSWSHASFGHFNRYIIGIGQNVQSIIILGYIIGISATDFCKIK